MEGLLLTPLKRIPTPGGDVLHGIKATDPGFAGFGEAYFSTVDRGAVKGWKRHNRMTLNFIVPCGDVQVRVYDEAMKAHQDFQLGAERDETHCRLTIPPGFWVAFAGLGAGLNLLLNVASLPHDPMESDRLPLDAIPWSWMVDV